MNSRFTKAARGAGIEVGPVHHWNFGKQDFPSQIVDPRNLIITESREAHEYIHRASSGTNIWGGTIDPRHSISIDSWYTPVAPGFK